MKPFLLPALLLVGGASPVTDTVLQESPGASIAQVRANEAPAFSVARDAQEATKAKSASPCDAGRDTPDKSSGSVSHIPCGYSLVSGDDFTSLSIAGNRGDKARWSSMFTQWNTRVLADNGDRGVKAADGTTLPSGRTAGEALRASGEWSNRQNFLAEVSNSTLKLRAFPLRNGLQNEFWGFPYAASMISADQAPGIRYGYWEFKARINAIGKGQHLAFWLLPDDGSWPPEVDMLEVVGSHRQQFTANAHIAAESGSLPMTFYAEPPSADGFHVYGFEWTPSIMRWTVDGRAVREQASRIGDKPLHFLVSWEIASRWPGEPDSSTPWPAEVEIGYVRVYARKD